MLCRPLKLCLFAGAILSVFCFPSTATAQPKKALFVRGYNAVSLIGNPQSGFDATIKKQLRDHQITTLDQPTREALVAGVKGSDIIYLSTHSGPPYNSQQSLQVRPSPENNYKSPGGNSLVVSVDLRRAWVGTSGPRLVIINGCELTNPADQVPDRMRMNNAFGVMPDTKGKAFIGWNYKVIGRSQDASFLNLLTHWTTPNAQGMYPTLSESMQATNWGATKPPTVIGDQGIRYR